VAFRRALGATAGRSDKDYQKLRVGRAGLPDDDDDANAPSPPRPVVVAAATRARTDGARLKRGAGPDRLGAAPGAIGAAIARFLRPAAR
jgi:hypothetical protein